jgi:hypothetical protein
MRTTVDLPDDLLKRAKIAAVQRGTSLRELIGQALERELEDKPRSRRRMTEPPVKLGKDVVVHSLTNEEMAATLQGEDERHLVDVYSAR